MRLLVLLSLILSSSGVHASEMESSQLNEVEAAMNTINAPIEPVTTSQLKILGAGIVERKTHESIALACYNESCNEFRNVYLASDQKSAFWIGPRFIIPTDANGNSDEKNSKKEFKEYKKEFRHFVKSNHRNFSGALGMSTFAGGMILTTVLIAAGLMTAGTGTLIAGGLTIATLVTETKNLQFGAFYSAKQGMWTSFTNESGWNWSINSKRVSNSTFNDYFIFNTTFHSGALHRF